MLNLDDPIWKTFNGGYRIPYDASLPLRKLETINDENEINKILRELWQELHHQGDVDLASYFAMPHLIRIAKSKKLKQYDIPALVATIEIQRHLNNPTIPKNYAEDYLNGIKEIIDVIKLNQSLPWDKTYATCAAAAIIAVNGQPALANIIFDLDEEGIAEKFEKFLELYDEFDEWFNLNTKTH
ncbi:MAG: hypothetical protein SFU99_08160 [Saprospiraceae bacterium]|nr:hypothetical protein [Saprospiraceae bacterium]